MRQYLLNSIYILFSILFLFLLIYQIELKRRVLFSTLLTLSVNTIPEDETEYFLSQKGKFIRFIVICY